MDDTADMETAKCPNCGRKFVYDPADEPGEFPFCCQRCQWIDLGRWLSGEYRISKDLLANDDEQSE